MGGGSWSRDSFSAYSRSVGRTYDAKTDSIVGSYSAQDMFKSRDLDPALNPYGVIRECCDTEEHPETIPVILALDVTGSMGEAAVAVAKTLSMVMTQLYEKTKDIEFLVMGIGDLMYDHSPVQASQFESDIRIAEQLDKVYFEFGGGGNNYESYTAAWYFGARHTKLDCLNRGRKGIIITMGDETLNPYLPKDRLNRIFGDNVQADVETGILYEEVKEKFNVYHLSVNHYRTAYGRILGVDESFKRYLDDNHYRVVNLDNIASEIIDIVTAEAGNNQPTVEAASGIGGGGISW